MASGTWHGTWFRAAAPVASKPNALPHRRNGRHVAEEPMIASSGKRGRESSSIIREISSSMLRDKGWEGGRRERREAEA